LKLIAEQLGNVGTPVSEDRLVLRLVTGLSSAYDSLATIIQQLDPLPSFYKARSMLTLEETRRHKNTGVESALLHTQSDVSSATPNRSSDATPSRYNNRNTGGRGRQSRGKGNCRDRYHDGGRRSKKVMEKIVKRKRWSRHHSLLWKTMKKTTKKEKEIVCELEKSSEVGYAWGRYQHPHSACPKTVPLIKLVKSNVVY